MRESKNLEFKAILPPFNTLIKTCVAFANGFGGQIVIGVDDKSRQIWELMIKLGIAFMVSFQTVSDSDKVFFSIFMVIGSQSFQ